jgi:signal transduction histidine kinase
MLATISHQPPTPLTAVSGLFFIQRQNLSHIATDGQSMGLMTTYLLLFDSYGVDFVERPL